MSHKLLRWVAALVSLGVALATFGCSTTTTNSNANMSINTNANSNSAAAGNENANSASGTAGGTFSTREPDRYSMKMNVNLEGTANNRQGSMQVEIDFARVDANRRWKRGLPRVRISKNRTNF